MTARTIPPAHQLERRLIEEGFEPGAPEATEAWAQFVDQQVCTEAVCDCGHPGLLYRPYHNGDVYRILAVCPGCGDAQEM